MAGGGNTEQLRGDRAWPRGEQQTPGRRGYCILLKLGTGGRRNILLLVGGQIECYHLLLILLHHAEHSSTPDFCYNAELDVEWSGSRS